MRLIIACARSAIAEQNFAAVEQYVLANFAAERPSEIIYPGKQGEHTIGSKLAAKYGIPSRRFTPDWDGVGKAAAHRNNGDMVTYAMDEPGSAVIVVDDGVDPVMRSLKEAAGTYQVKAHSVMAFEFAAFGGAKDVTPNEPYIFPQSHSSLSKFETCPKQYEASYITREVVWKQSEAAAFGDRVHIAGDTYVKAQGQIELPPESVPFKKWFDWVLTRARNNGGQVMSERSAAVTRDKKPTPYSNKKRWIGGKIDVTILYPHLRLAEVFDYKTGKVKNDMTQLQLYGAFGLADFAEVDTVKAGYIWMKEPGSISPPGVYTRDNYNSYWDTFEHKYEKLMDAYRSGVFPPKPSGLCRQYCDVKSCQYWGKGR